MGSVENSDDGISTVLDTRLSGLSLVRREFSMKKKRKRDQGLFQIFQMGWLKKAGF